MDRAPSPYDFLPPVPSFQASSHDVAEGEMLAMPHVSGILGAGGEDVSPPLSWSGSQDGIQSYAVACFDPDAPTGSGVWHWVVYAIPTTVTELAIGSGAQDGSGLPDGTKQFGKTINEDPEKYFTEEIMSQLEKAAKEEFCYGV